MGYFVTVIRDSRVCWALGPFATHNEALVQVEPLREFFLARDPWADFDLFGTAQTDAPIQGCLNFILRPI